eukprot:m.43936 g.43936  ORF g.43936 m.43936 type:complete len:420 (+) comp12977_c0_seq1:113-1372(+)
MIPKEIKQSAEPEGGKGKIEVFWEAAVKSTDQMSPLLVKKMRTHWVVMLICIIGTAYIGSVAYQLDQLYFQCSEKNNCIACAVALGESKGSKCSKLAATDLNFAAGCASYSMPNLMKRIKPVLDGINKTAEEFHNKSYISNQLYHSLKSHHEITAAVQSNKQGQMIDPNPKVVAQFLKRHYIGLSDVVLDLSEVDPNNLTAAQASAVVAVGLKILYSYVATGCNIYSSYLDVLETDDDGFSGFGRNTTFEIHETAVNMTSFFVCGCDLACPRYTEKEGLTFDETIGALDVSLDVEIRNGLGSVHLWLPDGYIVDMSTFDNVSLDARDGRTSAEMVYIEEEEIQHCATNVFTSTPAQLNGALYECCTEKNNLEKLSQISAFSGFIMTCTILGTTVLFWFCGGSRDELTGAAYGAANDAIA